MAQLPRRMCDPDKEEDGMNIIGCGGNRTCNGRKHNKGSSFSKTPSYYKRRQRRWVPYRFFLCALGGSMLIPTWRLYTAETNTGSKFDSGGGKKKARPRMSPQDKTKEMRTPPSLTSHPPQPIQLDWSSNPRHACLYEIRKRHTSLLGPYFPPSESTPQHRQPQQHTILLVDPAYHSNVGDHMITLGELAFLPTTSRDHQQRRDIYQCSYVQAGTYAPPCAEEIPRHCHAAAVAAPTTAVWHGGGNWGDLWRRAQQPRIDSFHDLLNAGCAVLTMPNSWYYRNKETERDDIARIRRNIVRGLGLADTISNEALSLIATQRVAFTWREVVSHERAVQSFPFVTNVLVPDIAFQLGPYQSMPPVTDVVTDLLVLLRNDHESVYSESRDRRAFQWILDSVPGASQLSFSIVDWNDRLNRFDSDDIFFTDTAIQLLSLGRVVICDRLHAAILAYLADLPFIYLDQETGKITKTFDVAMQSGESCQKESRWARAYNLTDAICQAVHFLDRYQLRPLSRQQRRYERRQSDAGVNGV
jgi:exopolysaccharide biosynthesis predicted pyruvyltransferase EpsI